MEQQVEFQSHCNEVNQFNLKWMRSILRLLTSYDWSQSITIYLHDHLISLIYTALKWPAEGKQKCVSLFIISQHLKYSSMVIYLKLIGWMYWSRAALKVTTNRKFKIFKSPEISWTCEVKSQQFSQFINEIHARNRIWMKSLFLYAIFCELMMDGGPFNSSCLR